MKQLLLATALIALPVAVFSGVEHYIVAPKSIDTSVTTTSLSPAASLGDMSAFAAIVTDTQKIAQTGDFIAAETRITDLETAWDNAEATLRPMAPLLWGNVDDTADAAFSALRTGQPDGAHVDEALAQLQATLADPSLGLAPVSTAELLNGIAVSDAAGHPLPCEVMLTDLRDGIAAGRTNADTQPQISDLQSKALERCNADDDRRADAFTAQALALLAPAQVTK